MKPGGFCELARQNLRQRNAEKRTSSDGIKHGFEVLIPLLAEKERYPGSQGHAEGRHQGDPEHATPIMICRCFEARYKWGTALVRQNSNKLAERVSRHPTPCRPRLNGATGQSTTPRHSLSRYRHLEKVPCLSTIKQESSSPRRPPKRDYQSRGTVLRKCRPNLAGYEEARPRQRPPRGSSCQY